MNSCGCAQVHNCVTNNPANEHRARIQTLLRGGKKLYPGAFKLTAIDAASLLEITEQELSNELLRPGIIRSKLFKSTGLRVSANDVAGYLAELQRESRECTLGGTSATESQEAMA